MRNQAREGRASGAARSTLLWVFIVLGTLLVAGALTATSLGERIGLNFSPAPAAATSARAPGSTSVRQDSAAPFDFEALSRVVGVLSEAERARVVGDKAAFGQLAQREAARRALLRAAKSAGLENRPEVAFLMRRNAEQVLVDTFVQLNAGAALSDGFPSDDQVREFYQGNQERYRVEERIPVWQIFYSVSEDADKPALGEIEKRARATAKALKTRKLTFARAASEQSEHEASRLNGGFMGNLKVSELIPEIKSVVLEAKPGEIAGPVRSAAGLHLIKRGERIEAETLPLAQVTPQIRTALRRAAENQARQAVVNQALEQFGVAVSDAELERWRQALGKPEQRTATP